MLRGDGLFVILVHSSTREALFCLEGNVHLQSHALINETTGGAKSKPTAAVLALVARLWRGSLTAHFKCCVLHLALLTF